MFMSTASAVGSGGVRVEMEMKIKFAQNLLPRFFDKCTLIQICPGPDARRQQAGLILFNNSFLSLAFVLISSQC